MKFFDNFFDYFSAVKAVIGITLHIVDALVNPLLERGQVGAEIKRADNPVFAGAVAARWPQQAVLFSRRLNQVGIPGDKGVKPKVRCIC